MKPARIIVLVIAIAAGGIAAMFAGRSDPTPPSAQPAPVAQLETVEVLIANVDIGMGTTLSAADMRWQTWPASAAGPNFIRKEAQGDAIQQFAGAVVRQPSSSGEPIREG